MSDFELQVLWQLNPKADEFVPSQPSPPPPPGLDNKHVFEHSKNLNNWLLDFIDETINNVEWNETKFKLPKEKTE